MWPSLGGRYWVRTSDLFGVNEARYHCANRPYVPLEATPPYLSSSRHRMTEQLGACQLAPMGHSRKLIGDQQLSRMRLSSALLVSSGIQLGARTPEPVRLSQRTS